MSSRGAPGARGPVGPVRIIKSVRNDWFIEKQDVTEDVKMETKKLGWFDRWFMRKSREAWHNCQQEMNNAKPDYVLTNASAVKNSINTRNSIDMSLVRADGGWIVQFQSWDSRREENDLYHYVITDEEDFGQRLSEIITTQCLRI